MDDSAVCSSADSQSPNISQNEDNFLNNQEIYVQSCQRLSQHPLILSLQLPPFPLVVKDDLTIDDKFVILKHISALIDSLQSMETQNNDLTKQISELMQQYDQMEDRYHLEKQQSELANRKALEIEMKKRMLEKEWEIAQKKLKERLTSLEKKNIMIKNRDKQYRAEIRKRDLEFRKLQQHYEKAIIAGRKRPGPQRAGSTVLLNGHKERAIRKCQFKRKPFVTGNVNNNRDHLDKDNQNLQTFLMSFYHKLHNIVKGSETLVPSYLKMPFDLVKDEIEAIFTGKINDIEDEIKKLRKRSQMIQQEKHNTDKALIEALKRQIEEQKGIIQKQDDILQSDIFSNSLSTPLAKELEESKRLSCLQEIHHSARGIKHQKEFNLQGAQQIIQERFKFEEEKKKFEQEIYCSSETKKNPHAKQKYDAQDDNREEIVKQSSKTTSERTPIFMQQEGQKQHCVSVQDGDSRFSSLHTPLSNARPFSSLRTPLSNARPFSSLHTPLSSARPFSSMRTPISNARPVLQSPLSKWVHSVLTPNTIKLFSQSPSPYPHQYASKTTLFS